MKEIIYLDTIALHSFLAQSSGGLETSKSREDIEEIKDTSEKTAGFKSRSSIEGELSSGKYKIPFLYNSASGKLKGAYAPGKFSEEKMIAMQTESAKEIINLQLHDDALDKLVILLSENNLLSPDESREIGKLILVEEKFSIFDIDMLSKILDPDILLSIIFHDQDQELLELELQRGVTQKNNKSNINKKITQFKNDLKKEKTVMESQLKIVYTMLKFLKNTLSTPYFMKIGNLLAPLKQEHLRENASQLAFKYGNNGNVKVKILARITKEVNKSGSLDFDKELNLDELSNITNSLLKELKIMVDGEFVVSPIAIYFE